MARLKRISKARHRFADDRNLEADGRLNPRIRQEVGLTRTPCEGDYLLARLEQIRDRRGITLLIAQHTRERRFPKSRSGELRFGWLPLPYG